MPFIFSPTHGTGKPHQIVCTVQFTKYKEMQRLLELDRAAWDEQHKTTGRRGNPAASFTLGSMIGGVANAIRGVGGQGGPATGAAQPPQNEPHATAAAAPSEQPQQHDVSDVGALADEEPVLLDSAPHPVRHPLLSAPRLACLPATCLYLRHIVHQ